MELGDILLCGVIVVLAGYLGTVGWKDHKRVSRIRKYYRDNNLL